MESYDLKEDFIYKELALLRKYVFDNLIEEKFRFTAKDGPEIKNIYTDDISFKLSKSPF